MKIAYQIANMVMALNPGQEIQFDMRALRQLRELDLYGNGRTPEQVIMDKVVGSAFEFRFFIDEQKKVVTFVRLAKPVEGNLRTYVSADREHLYNKRPDGLYEPKL